MRSFNGLVRGSTIAAVLIFASTALAQTGDLRQAIDLFDKQEYAASQEALLKVARDKLSEAEQNELDAYLKEVPEAIKGAAKAKQDKADADTAYQAGKWDDAERLYQTVSANKYGKSDARDDANRQLNQITEKRELGQAVAPNGGTVRVEQSNHQESARPDETSHVTQERVIVEMPVQDGGGDPATVVDEMRRRDELLWQRAVARMQESVTRARDAVARKDFDAARQDAQNATQLIEESRIYAEPASRYEAARAVAAGLKQEVEDAYAVHSMDAAKVEREEIKNRIQKSRLAQEEKRREQIEQLFASAAQLRKEQRFREAADMLRQVLFLDPSNSKAIAQLDVDQDYESFRNQLQIHKDRNVQLRRTYEDAEETKIPWQNEVLYPSNWLQVTGKREFQNVGVSGEGGESRDLNRKLDEILPDVRFQDQPFENLVEFLQELKGVNMAVDWEDLSANGVEKDKPVTIKLTNLPFRTVLREVLTQVGGDVRLDYTIDEGLIKIATKEKLDKDKEVRVYDINDLLVNIPRFTNAANLNPAQALNQAGQGGGGGGGGGGQLFEDNDAGGGEGGEGRGGGAGGRDQIIQELQDIIRQTVEPDSWRETGAGDGSIRELNGQLIVYNTSDAHRQVQSLLDQLREFRALQIAVETRFLTVSSNFLEEIGVDLDFVFNSGSAGFDQGFTPGGAPLVDPFTGGAVLVPRQFNRIGTLPATPGFGVPIPTQSQGLPGQPYITPGLVPSGTGVSPHFDEMTPISARQNSLNLVSPANFQTGVPGSFADAFRQGAQPAMQIAGSFLDNLQVDFLIRATQANSRSSVVQAPRLILFNGQRANIFVGRTQTYVASLQPQIAQQAAAFAPIIGAAQSGSSLDVEATISADRKYVTVTVQTQRAQDPILTRFEIQRASGNAPGAFITNVDQFSATINTTVSIPDGGTVMLGGLKQVGEIEVDAGVPILSKIPILKRAFTNTTTIKDTQTLLILIKAKIIIQKEAEEEAFPTLTSAGG